MTLSTLKFEAMQEQKLVQYKNSDGEAIVVYAKNHEGGLMYFAIFNYPQGQAEAMAKFRHWYEDPQAADCRMMTIEKFQDTLL